MAPFARPDGKFMLPVGNLCMVSSTVMSPVQQELDPETLLLNVGIIPPGYITNEAVTLSQRTQSIGGLFELNRTTRLPHVTIYMARFSRCKIDAVRKILSAMIPTLEERALDHRGYNLTPHRYYEISYAKTPELEQTQVSVTRELYELRYAPGNPVIENYFGEYEGDIKKSVERWGYDCVGNLYRPHLTLTRFPADARPITTTSLPKSSSNLSFAISSIGLFRADDMGSARELISEWNIG
jgi:hypothetical protein